MVNAEEERRALAYRQQCERRNAFQQALNHRLAGSAKARQQLEENWEPLVGSHMERTDSVCDKGDD